MDGKIACLGDSNTYGFNPYNFFGDPYPTPWPKALSGLIGEAVINLGENGAEIPHRPVDYYWIGRDLTSHGPIRLLTIMLGSNDILNSRGGNLDQIKARMDKLISYLKEKLPETKLLLLAPPQLCGAEDFLNPVCIELSVYYQELAEKEGLLFADPKEWDLKITGDGVHLAESAHIVFAEKLADFLKANNLI